MAEDDEITCWLSGLARGEDTAIEQIWRTYYDRLVRLARGKLAAGRRRIADEEDVVLSAFHSFCCGAAAGRFPQLDDRQDLWKLLVTITARKAARQVRREMQQKRGAGNVRGESVFPGTSDYERGSGIAGVLGTEPTPEFAALAADECDRLLNALTNDQLRQIAVWKLEGYSNDEIASELQCAPRTIERKLHRIRDLWSRAEA